MTGWSDHCVTAQMPIGLDDHLEVDVGFRFSPGCPEQGPTYACGGQPAEPPEIDFLWAQPTALVVEPTYRQPSIDAAKDFRTAIETWASDWLSGQSGRERAIEEATRNE